MKRVLLTLILYIFVTGTANSQSFSVHDLISLSAMPPASVGHYMLKNGFIPDPDNTRNDSITSYIQRYKRHKADRDTFKSIDLYERQKIKYFVFHTSSFSEYIDGRQSLLKSRYFYNTKQDIKKDSLMIFQKANTTITSSKEMKDSIAVYTFILKQKKVPDSIAYAEDLLQFDSREYLVSYFGEKNVSNDLYYFSEKELKKCSVLFSGTHYQAVFVWGDEDNLNNLAYILVSNVLPTKIEKEKGTIEGNDNKWMFHSGLHWGMPIKDILRLNEMDFYMYGSKSDLAMMVKPEVTGKIDFKKTAIMFTCSECAGEQIFDQDEVSALDVAKAQLPLKIFDIIIYP